MAAPNEAPPSATTSDEVRRHVPATSLETESLPHARPRRTRRPDLRPWNSDTESRRLDGTRVLLATLRRSLTRRDHGARRSAQTHRQSKGKTA